MKTVHYQVIFLYRIQISKSDYSDPLPIKRSSQDIEINSINYKLLVTGEWPVSVKILDYGTLNKYILSPFK